jgi:predicted metal-binding membrane protein
MVLALRRQRTRVLDALRWRPEWWAALVVAAAWLTLLAGVGGHAGMADGHDMASAGDAGWSGILAQLPAWVLMVVAMMVLVTLPAVGYVGLNSIRRRRVRAMSIYLAVYVGAWIVFGLVVLGAEELLRAKVAIDSRSLLTVALAAAAVWQLTRFKLRALYACGRTVPLPPVGLRADAGCARFALVHATRCMRSCWALMIVMTLVGHWNVLWMAAFTGVVAIEELTLVGRRLLCLSAVALALASGAVSLS